MMDDYEAVKQLRNSGYGQQVLIVRYEDIALDKTLAAKNIYQ